MYLTKKPTLFALFLFLTHLCFAQKETDKPKKIQHELGLNVTNLLTDLLGNNNRTDPGVYLISYKRLVGNKAFRLGAAFNFSLKNDNTFSFSSQLNNQNFQLRLGRETRQNLSSRFQYYYGLDGITGYQQEQSNVATQTSIITQTDHNFTIGGGPILGFQFAIFDKLLIGTEGSLYAVYSDSSTKFVNVNSSAPIPSRASSGVIVQTTLPKFLFLIVKF